MHISKLIAMPQYNLNWQLTKIYQNEFDSIMSLSSLYCMNGNCTTLVKPGCMREPGI